MFYCCSVFCGEVGALVCAGALVSQPYFFKRDWGAPVLIYNSRSAAVFVAAFISRITRSSGFSGVKSFTRSKFSYDLLLRYFGSYTWRLPISLVGCRKVK